MIQGKVWGTTRQLISRETFSLHRLEIKAGGFCSEHVHHAKSNHFYVESGVLIVDTFEPGAMDEEGTHDFDRTVLRAGDEMTVEPGTGHQFSAVSNCIVYETYWVVLREDIERFAQGGMAPKGTKVE